MVRIISQQLSRFRSVEPRKIGRIPTIRGSTFFHGDNSISQLDCRKIFRLDIFPPSGDPALVTDHQLSVEAGRRKVPKVPRENRICEMCNKSLVETEFNSLTECDHYSFARRKFFDRFYTKFPKVRSFICEDEDIISATLEMIRENFTKRKATIESQK